MAETLMKAGLNTLIGLSIVFAVLVLISFIISLFKYISILEKKLADRKQRKAAKQKSNSESPVEKTIEQIVQKEELSNDLELVAVITAAICAATNQSSDSFVVRSVRKVSRKG